MLSAPEALRLAAEVVEARAALRGAKVALAQARAERDAARNELLTVRGWLDRATCERNLAVAARDEARRDLDACRGALREARDTL